VKVVNKNIPVDPVTVDYFGIKLQVRRDGWISTDHEGVVSWTLEKPVADNEFFWYTEQDMDDLLQVDLEGRDWKQTLRKVDEITAEHQPFMPGLLPALLSKLRFHQKEHPEGSDMWNRYQTRLDYFKDTGVPLK